MTEPRCDFCGHQIIGPELSLTIRAAQGEVDRWRLCSLRCLKEAELLVINLARREHEPTAAEEAEAFLSSVCSDWKKRGL